MKVPFRPALLLVLFLVAPASAAPDHETGEFVLTAPKGATYTLIVPDSYAEVLAAFADRVAAHNEAADDLWAEAEAARDADDPKAAIQACLDIRDDCYVADGESVAKAKALLADYRADEDVAKRFRRQLRGTEDWK